MEHKPQIFYLMENLVDLSIANSIKDFELLVSNNKKILDNLVLQYVDKIKMSKNNGKNFNAELGFKI